MTTGFHFGYIYQCYKTSVPVKKKGETFQFV